MEKEGLKREILEGNRPFFETSVHRLPCSPAVACGVFGVLLTGLHAAIAAMSGANVLDDCSWMLGVMCGVCLYLLNWAAGRLRRLVAAMLDIFSGRPEEFRSAVAAELARTLSNRYMLCFAAVFGPINCGFGLHFGIPYENWAPWLSMMLEIFLIGNLCGMAFGGIIGVIRMMSRISKRELLLIDLCAPDTCGGTFFIGKTLLQFALVTLIMGLFIACFIYEGWWRPDLTLDLRISMAFWMLFPYTASCAVLIVPVRGLHGVLQRYKQHMEVRIDSEIEEVRSELHALDDTPETARVKTLVLHYDRLHQLKSHIALFNTWPYDRHSRQVFYAYYGLSLLLPLCRAVSVLRVVDYLIS